MESVSRSSDPQTDGLGRPSRDISLLMLVDANPERAAELTDFLVGLGREVSWAKKVEEILDQPAEPCAEAILVAVDETSEGLEDCRLLRECGVVVPILLIGAVSPSQEFLRAGLEAGVDDFLTWPLQPEDLILRLGIVHRRHQEIVQNRIREDRLQTLEKALETVQLGVTITDIEGRIQYTNPADAHMHGYGVDELMGQDVRVLAPSQTWRPMAPTDLRKADRWTRESINLRSDGTAFPVQLWSDVVTDCRGEPNRIITICQDLTKRRKAQAALHQKEEQLAAARGANDGLWSWNLETGFIDYSPRWKAMLGFGEDEIDGQIEDWLDRVHPEDRKQLDEDLRRHIHGDTEFLENQHRIRHRNGDWLWMLCRGRAVRESTGRALSLAGSQIDITAINEAEDALRESELRFRSVAQSASDAIISTDDQGRIVFWNQSAERLFGYSWQEIRNQTLGVLMSETDQHLYRQSFERLIGDAREAAGPAEFHARHRSGESFPVEVSLATWKVGERTFYSGIVRDIRERKVFESRLVEMATHDSLTGLFNRRHLMETLTKFLASARRYRFPLTVCLCDLDRFKAINDRCGHQTGDRVLEEVGSLIADTVRNTDLCCRYGGDEICILFPYSTATESSHAIRRIQKGLEQLSISNPQGEHIRISISFGLAEMPTEEADETTALHLADMALYDAKASKSGFELRPADISWWTHPTLSHASTADTAESSARPELLVEGAFRRGLDREIHDAHRHGHALSLAVVSARPEAFQEQGSGTLGDGKLEHLLEHRLPSLLRIDDLVCRSGPGELSVALPHTTEQQVENALGRLVESILEVSDGHLRASAMWFGVAMLGPRFQTVDDLQDAARRSLRPYPPRLAAALGKSVGSALSPPPPA